MLKSPEEYLSGLTFDLPENGEKGEKLNSFERAFVEKYLGLTNSAADTGPLAEFPVALPHIEIAPEPLPQLQPVKEQPRQFPPVLEPKIEIAQDSPPQAATPAIQIIAVEDSVIEISDDAPQPSMAKPAVATTVAETDIGVTAQSPPAAAVTVTTVEKAATTVQLNAVPEMTLREKMRAETEVQMVSFFVENQLFLLPVAAIHEVIRHMELIKVPQAPPFVAGAINLRGSVIPIVHLSGLLTNAPCHLYDERKFIIVCGTENLRLGLIIDRISSMHLLPQNKLIWNAESKLGEAADFLYAIADLNDKVCGVVAPELIAQKILSP